MRGLQTGLLLTGIVLGVYALLMDTTVLSVGGGRVSDLGLRQQQRLLILTAGITVLAGAIMKRRRPLRMNTSDSNLTSPRLSIHTQYRIALRTIRFDDAASLAALLRRDHEVVNFLDSKQQTLLHHAAAAESISCVCVLLGYGALPCRIDSAGKLPEDYAGAGEAGSAVRTLLRAAS